MLVVSLVFELFVVFGNVVEGVEVVEIIDGIVGCEFEFFGGRIVDYEVY